MIQGMEKPEVVVDQGLFTVFRQVQMENDIENMGNKDDGPQ